jgi:hypothetical protein
MMRAGVLWLLQAIQDSQALSRYGIPEVLRPPALPTVLPSIDLQVIDRAPPF